MSVSSPQPNRKRLVLLLSTNFAGSHLLSHLLSAHPDCMGVGELYRYRHLMDEHKEKPVVADYDDEMFADLNQFKLQDWHQVVIERFVARYGHQPVVIDNSKRVHWATKVMEGDYDIRFVHLLRDPRALVLRWLNTYTTVPQLRKQRLRVARRVPSRMGRVLFNDWITVFVYKWLRENRHITNFLAQVQCPTQQITYHDMVFDTEACLDRLMPGLGLCFDPAQLRFGDAQHLGTRKVEHRDSVNRSEIRPDLKWQSQLDPVAIDTVCSNRDLSEYLAQRGLRLGDTGLLPA